MKISSLLVLNFAAAAPTKSHQLYYVKRGQKSLPYYYPESTFKTSVPADSFVSVSDDDALKVGIDYLAQSLGVSKGDLQITASHKSKDGVLHVYASRLLNGVPVSNQNAAVHLKNGQVVVESASFSNSGNNFVGPSVSKPESKISLAQAVKTAEAEYGIKRDSFPASNAYLEIPGNKIVYAHVFQLRDDEKQEWLQVSVDAQTGEIVHVVDYYNRATYKVIELPKLNPLDGFNVVTDPENSKASPNGWSKGTQTVGNNVDSHIGGLRTDGGSSKNFDTKWDASQGPTNSANKQAAIVNNFYISNMVHDIAYQYGFNEAAGNFQEDNFGKGGKGGDSVDINNQAWGKNNANFATPPDGQRPTMNMFIFDITRPNRDGSLDNVIPIHEYTHGISNRLTGGPSNTNCLSDTESGGMGEGWSDAMAVFLTMKPTATRNTDFPIGAYVVNKPQGIREYVYSTNMKTNPMTYNTVASQNEVHAIGTTWATILYEMYWALVDQYGFSANLFDATQRKGNIMAIQLMIGGMAVQPCNPTILNARDAIIAADVTYYGGANKCLLWKAFAKRGLGVDAKQSKYTNGFSVPSECSGTQTTTVPVSTTTAVPTTTVATTTTSRPTTTTTTTRTTTTTSKPSPTSTPIPPTNTCQHNICTTGWALKSSCDPCVAKIVQKDWWCGWVYWNDKCVSEVETICGLSC